MPDLDFDLEILVDEYKFASIAERQFIKADVEEQIEMYETALKKFNEIDG
jgi:hypothetical protein